ncbi:hypothetical protein AA0118_g7632 [Alternaria tenuissima]|nr:hypothetical protein AA0118_g7632 [Alternaria tenuissima]
MTCIFYILLKAATPIIMGLNFLEQTKTMTEHRDRLVRVPRPAYQALSVCSLDKPRRLLTCELDSKQTLATPDSGSEIDLMSFSFASERDFKVYPGEEIIEVADGSISITSGFVRTSLAITPTNVPNLSTIPRNYVTVDFFLLDSLSHDLIVGEDSLDRLQVFTDHQSALVCLPDGSGPLGLNRIRHLGAIDRIVSWIKKKIRGSGSDNDTNMDTSFGSQAIDQHENNRREREAARIAILPIDEQQIAIDAEVVRQRAYKGQIRLPKLIFDETVASRASPPPFNFGSPSTPNKLGVFICEYPGCTAAPFQTQYLLK